MTLAGAVMTPFDCLADMAMRARAAAAPVPSGSVEETHEWFGLGFQLAGVRFVAPVTEVSEVLTSPGLTRVPGVRPWVLGIANLRGQLIPVHDLHLYLGLEPTLPRSQSRVLVVESGDLVVGLVVEQSHGMQRFAPDLREEGLLPRLDALSRWVGGSWPGDDGPWFELSLVELIRGPEFLQIADGTG